MFDTSAERSASFCKRTFPCYASFAHLPLYVAVVVCIKESWVRRWYYEIAESSHQWTDDCKDSVERLLSRLNFDDHDFFNIDDYELFLAIDGPPLPLSVEQIERDRQQLLAEVAKPVNMTKDHAKSMLKAVEFWKLRYDAKYQEWIGRINEARSQEFAQVWACDETPPNPVEVDDEGYSSE
jgi:hypothetical protein